MSKSPARPTEPQLLSMGKLILLANTFAYLLAYLPTCLLAFVDVVAFKIIKILLYCCVAAMVMLVCYIL